MNSTDQKMCGAAAIECIIDLFFFISNPAGRESLIFHRYLRKGSEFLSTLSVGELIDLVREG